MGEVRLRGSLQGLYDRGHQRKEGTKGEEGDAP